MALIAYDELKKKKKELNNKKGYDEIKNQIQ